MQERGLSISGPYWPMLVASIDREIVYRQTQIDKLTHEVATLKRNQFGKRSEQLCGEQRNLLDEAVDSDLATIEEELAQLSPSAQRCRPSCRVWRSSMSRIPPFARGRVESVQGCESGLGENAEWSVKQFSTEYGYKFMGRA